MPSAGGSILYGMGPDGNLHHINDVERGEACNCVCPDPNCGQALIARKGEKKAHHFAHKRGTCEWAAEYVISSVAAGIVQRAGAIVFPQLTFKDAFTGSDEIIAQGQSVRISSAHLVQESGRGNPDLLVTRKTSSGEVREFLVLFSLVHGVSHKQREAVRQAGRDSFVVDLNYLMMLRKEDLGKHFDRERILLGFQDPRFLSRILTQGEGRCMRWSFNARRTEAETENRARHNEWLAEQEAKRKAAEEAHRKRDSISAASKPGKPGCRPANTKEQRGGATMPRVKVTGNGEIEEVVRGKVYKIRHHLGKNPETGRYRRSPKRTVYGTKTKAREGLAKYKIELEGGYGNPDKVTLGEILDDKTLPDGYALALPKAEELVMSMIPAAEVAEGAHRIIRYAYPQRAIRELLSNAVIHQDLTDTSSGPRVDLYENRVSFSNPGVSLIPAKRFLNAQPKTRNNGLVGMLRQMDLCEEGDTGWDIAVAACEAAHLPSPQIESDEDPGTRVTLFRGPAYDRMTKRERTDALYWHACLMFANGASMNNQSLRERFGLSSERKNMLAMSRLIRECCDTGLIKEEDEEAGPKNKRYIPGWA